MVILKFFYLGGGWLTFAMLFGAWDTISTATMSGVALAVCTVLATAWPQLSAAGVKAQAVRQDAAVEAAVRFYRQTLDQLRQDFQAAEQRHRKDLDAAVHELRAENQRLEQQLRKAESEATRWRYRCEMALGKLPSSGDDIPESPAAPPTKDAPP